MHTIIVYQICDENKITRGDWFRRRDIFYCVRNEFSNRNFYAVIFIVVGIFIDAFFNIKNKYESENGAFSWFTFSICMRSDVGKSDV